MSKTKEVFRNIAESLSQTHSLRCIYFTTDLEKYDSVSGRGLKLPGVEVNETFKSIEKITKCIKEKHPVKSFIDTKVFGEKIKIYVWPIIEECQVIGSFGYMIPCSGSAAEIFDDLIKQASFSENAYLSMITSKARNRRKLGIVCNGKDTCNKDETNDNKVK